MDLPTTPLYLCIVCYARHLLLSPQETEDIASALIAKYASEQSDVELQFFVLLPPTPHLRQAIKCDLLDFRRAVACSRDREVSYDAHTADSPVTDIPKGPMSRYG